MPPSLYHPNPDHSPVPRLGVGVFLVRPDGSFLIGHRVSAHGYDTWGLVGGHVEFGESPEETAKREVYEETGLRIDSVEFAGYANSIFQNNNRHYVTLFFMARIAQSTDPRVCEPDTTDIWKYVTLETLPPNLLQSLSDYIEKNKSTLASHIRMFAQ